MPKTCLAPVTIKTIKRMNLTIKPEQFGKKKKSFMIPYFFQIFGTYQHFIEQFGIPLL
jgi:hypothetical protein